MRQWDINIYIYIYIYIYIDMYIYEGSSPKLALSVGRSRENIES